MQAEETQGYKAAYTRGFKTGDAIGGALGDTFAQYMPTVINNTCVYGNITVNDAHSFNIGQVVREAVKDSTWPQTYTTSNTRGLAYSVPDDPFEYRLVSDGGHYTRQPIEEERPRCKYCGLKRRATDQRCSGCGNIL